jgi:hypothetical protein
MGVKVKRIMLVTLATIAVLLLTCLAGQAHVRGGIFIGPVFGPWWWGPPYPYYASQPIVVQQQPEVYIQQPAPRTEGTSYWYFCRKPEGYYPYVKHCPDGWLKVVPPSTPPERNGGGE